MAIHSRTPPRLSTAKLGLRMAGASLVCFSVLTISGCLRPAAPGPDNTWHFELVRSMDHSLRRIAGQASACPPAACGSGRVCVSARGPFARFLRYATTLTRQN